MTRQFLPEHIRVSLLATGRATVRNLVYPQPRTGGQIARLLFDEKACPTSPGALYWVPEPWGLYDKYTSRRDIERIKCPSSPDGIMIGAEGYWKRRIVYKSDGEIDVCNPWHWRAASVMPKWAARLQVRVASVRVVQDGPWFWEIQMERI